MHQSLPWSCSWLPTLTGAGSGFLESLLRVAYHNYAHMRHLPKCNAWGAKSGMLHDYAQLTHTNPY
jgi:hypothetical protein